MKRNNYEDSHPAGAQLLLALDGELSPEEAASITHHVEGCAECHAQWEQWRRIAERILDYHNGTLQARVPQTSAATPRMETLGRRKRARVITALAGAAAALVCVVWFFGRSDRQAPAPLPPSARATALAQVSAPTQVVVAATEAATLKPQAVRRRSPQRKQDSTAADDSRGFVALPFSDEALPLRDATVVRVQLPVEELRLAGLPVEGEYRGAMIQADVLLGMDGLPRGIRLVQ